MRTLTDQLAQYAAYHRDRRNIATHFVGIPLIVVALAILLSRPAWSPAALPFSVSPAWLLFGAATLYYLVLDVPLGVAMAVFSAACVALGSWFAQQSTTVWLGSGVGLFVIGWIIQFVGHVAYEHRKPAFVDDVIGLLIGPLFVLAEALFSVGWRPALRDAIDAQAGPVRGGAPGGTHAGHGAGRR
ncbi:MAG TPA: Mpo1-like protein [Paraburkholderia sp.]|nr:Mpo1-like protein [Paraburkholderia sp.]